MAADKVKEELARKSELVRNEKKLTTSMSIADMIKANLNINKIYEILEKGVNYGKR